jgi:hypothetical protein
VDQVAYVRRQNASMGLPKRVLITIVPTPQGERFYERNSPVDQAKLQRDYTPEVLREERHATAGQD